ncbi:MAG: hypothetical protein H6813_07450 [Phycisphaeraceae bacterium]|nr:hypothetical protein [Phycisphaeraceae bacterium]MCB9848330.1 hypothetical protein [Phycisphaeraceae bacterium]
MSRLDAIARFLGLPPDDRTPLALLNITREQCESGAIDAALARRLERVDRHPEASTPEADTVRMALHTAAAQLADPSVRAQILGEREAAPTAPAPAPVAAPGVDRQALLAFRRTAIRTILLCRGWNRRSRRMLAAVAGASGIGPEQMALALRSLSGPGAGAQALPGAAPRPAPRRQTIFESFHEAPAKTVSLSSGVILGIGGAIAALAIVLIVAVRVLWPGASETGAAEKARAPDAATAPSENTGRRDEQRAPEPPRAARDEEPRAATARVQEPPDPAGLVRTLRRCVEIAATDPGDAAWRLEQAVSQLSGAWTSLEPATNEAAMDAVLAFITEAPAGGERSNRALRAIAAGAQRLGSAQRLGAFEVAPAVWSCGALAEIIASPGTRGPVREFAGSVLGSAVGGFDASGSATFADGALAALTAMAPALSRFEGGRDSLEAWRRWREALAAATASDVDPVRRELETIDAVEAVMRFGPSLAQRPDAYAEIATMLKSLRWSPDSASGAATPARLALLRWFDDQTITTEDLALITEWLVRESETPGVGIQMALRRTAGLERRAALRDNYAAVWSLADGVGADELAIAWNDAARRAITGSRSPSADLVGSLVRAAELSRLSEAAARRWRRENTAAGLILHDPFGAIERAAQPSGAESSLENAGGRRDGAWALEFLSVSNSSEQKFASISRLELWGGSIGPIDGDVLARAALLGSPLEVRTAAQRTVRKRADEPAVVNGLLESIDAGPRNDSTRALIESVTGQSLPSPRNAAWPRAARLALTERLLEMLAGRSGLSAVDRVSGALASSYRGRAGDDAVTSGQNAATPEGSARALWNTWREEAGRLVGTPRAGRTLEMIDRRRGGRTALASGPEQRFAAEQASIAEAMGYVIASERPSRAPEVEGVMRRLASDRRRADSVFGQIESTERAMLTLWMIRFGEELPEQPDAEEGPA